MPFEIRVHPELPIVEIVYPEQPSESDVEDYVMRIRTVMDEQRGPWVCLVDQRRLAVMAPELVETVSALNVYAQSRGMLGSARVVRSAVGGLQAKRMARESAVTSPTHTFDAREPAVSWLREVLRASSGL
jgi:hypothetical protein